MSKAPPDGEEPDPVGGFLAILSGDAGALLLGLAITPAIVRLLGTAAYGDYAFVISVLSVLVVVTNAGIGDGIRKFLPEARDDGWQPRVFGFYFLVAVGLAVTVGGAVAMVATAGAGRILGAPAFSGYFLLAAVLLVARQLFLTCRSGLMGLGLERYSEPLLVVQKAVFGLVAVGLAALGWGVDGVLVGHVLATALVGTVAFVLIVRRLNLSEVRPAVVDGLPVRELLSFNVASVAMTLLMTSLYHVDIILLQPYAGSAATGRYRAALLVAEFVWFVPFALQLALLQSTAALWARSGVEAVSTVASRATRYTVALTLLVAVGIAALVEAFVPLYFGAGFDGVSDIVLLLLPGAVGFAVARPILAVGQAAGEVRHLVAVTGGAAVLNLGLNLVLIPRYGTAGAAVATSLSYGSMLGFQLLGARRIGFSTTRDLRLGRVLATTLITGGVVFGLAAVLPDLLSVVLVPPIGAAVFVVVGLRVGVTGGDELAGALERLPPRIAPPITRVIERIEG